jgi:hypothetical protein
MLDPPGTPFDFSARTEQRHHRRSHRRGDVHRRRIDADERARLARECSELAQPERADQVDDAWARRAGAGSEDGLDEISPAARMEDEASRGGGAATPASASLTGEVMSC